MQVPQEGQTHRRLRPRELPAKGQGQEVAAQPGSSRGDHVLPVPLGVEGPPAAYKCVLYSEPPKTQKQEKEAIDTEDRRWLEISQDTCPRWAGTPLFTGAGLRQRV